ncbi:efflux RND transporter periplasmic adaptor subunit [Chryseosolibacter indicus]|uniref:Efflux RND transporter periplasmic adaptor subunit n=1 Tax=Chryseosolibacter indicus TaxID=2782351 RepID=A0ABS5VWX6_9BACT|nr:efflux RND transporter periplasmic adaptor subunit [Chryseosolibacter indicus]MBT1705337.1 efflux RND transporter periplasmic adaptor subunit [Chryseosolibacter indicus]
MKSNIYFRLFFVAIIAGLLAACSAASPEDDKQARLEKLKKDQVALTKEIQKLEAEIAAANPDAATSVRAKEVSITALAPRSFDHFVQTQGLIESDNNVLVSAKTMGVVTQVYVTEGQSVSKGQVLAQIDNSVIVTNIQSMEAQLELAKSVYERQKNLWDQKIGTEVQFLQAKTNKESLEKQLASLREQNEMAKIKAPISGTVDEVVVKVGENISPGMPAARVVNASDLKLAAKVSEAFVTTIKKGNKVIVSIPELKKDIEAKVTFVGKNIDPLSRTFNVEINLPNHPDLRPNMTGTIKVVFNTEPSAIVVPVNVIQTVNNEKIVYVAENNGKQTVARKKIITVDGVFNNLAQVQGLKAGDKIVTFGYQGLSDGEVIKI